MCPHESHGKKCKILTRHFEGRQSTNTVDNSQGKEEDEGGGWAWLPSLPACSNIHISFEFLTTRSNALLMYNGPDQFGSRSSQNNRPNRFLYDDSENIVNITSSIDSNVNSFGVRNISTNSNLVEQYISEENGFSTLTNGTSNLDLLTLESHHKVKKPEGDFSFYKSRSSESSNLFLHKKRTKRNINTENTRQSDEVFALELKDGRPQLLLDLGGGPLVISLNESYSLSDNTWHRIDIFWKDQVSYKTFHFIFKMS